MNNSVLSALDQFIHSCLTLAQAIKDSLPPPLEEEPKSASELAQPQPEQLELALRTTPSIQDILKVVELKYQIHAILKKHGNLTRPRIREALIHSGFGDHPQDVIFRTLSDNPGLFTTTNKYWKAL